MFVGNGTPRKPKERREARRLRRDLGMPIKRIAAKLGVSPSSVLYWTRDITLTAEQRERNLRGPTGPQNPDHIAARVASWKERNRAKRLAYQLEGRARARLGDLLHQAGCMLYWAEGSKERNCAIMANSDVHMLRLFVTFLTECFDVRPERLTLKLNVYTGNGLTITQIEDWWLETLGVPRTSLRKHMVNHFPTSSSGGRINKLPYGVCTVTLHNTRIVQHIYGAIQEYGGFEEPRWLDGRPIKCRPRKKRSKAAA